MILKFVSLSFLIMILTRAAAAFKLPSKRLLPHFSTKLHYHIASLVGTQTSSDGLGPSSQSLKVINVVGESEMEELGASFAKVLRAGHVLLLRGDLGAGKSTFCRGLIRTLCEEPELIVTSPSYLLDNTYDFSPSAETNSIIHHMDLYRLPNGCDLSFLSIPTIFSSSLCLIEWPERLGSFQPTEYASINFKINADESRCADIHFIGKKYHDLYTHLKSYSI